MSFSVKNCEYLLEYTMSFGGFIKKRGLRIKMRNYDPYKKTILFFSSLVNIVLILLISLFNVNFTVVSF